MEEITILRETAQKTIEQTTNLPDLEQLRVTYLGRKGEINRLMSKLPTMEADKRNEYGKEVNDLKQEITKLLQQKEKELKQQSVQEHVSESIDVTIPGIKPRLGHIHPVTQAMDEILNAFTELGYEIVEGPDVENDHYNFEVLNIPKTHPARDLQDTFWLTNGLLPRTHTSAMQVRVMEKRTPPFKIAVPGWVYRQEREDVTHASSFHQIEGFAVGEGISFSNLKGTLFTLLRKVLGEETELKFRASYFPYVEPCAEVSATCPHCKGKGCDVCKQSGWIEILGSGMIHPVVLKNAGIDPQKYSGFAFAFGSTRLAMLKYKINDIRLFTGGDLRFLSQF
ncbi:phenylalanine--tRNA ligase subunit alpha [Candidatus Roizmanbacteria bacterium]|nr:phenylalanine--tRNA ligase subunit alpha [Candidatus Roizmanbacteria bacterium]